MKNFLWLILASAIVGFACFAVMHWIFKIASRDALVTAFTVFLTGIIVEYIRPYLERKKVKKSH